VDASLIQGMGKELDRFLGEFDDCFGRGEPREHLRTYVCGQLSDLKRKSVEPIALAGDVPPRTLQEFLNTVRWDEQRMRDRIQHILARDHADPRAIGVIDETGNPKKGRHTAGVQRQRCGRTGNVDNCVVAVHLGYVTGDFQCLLDSDIFLPKEWASDLGRRAEAKIPPEVTFRTKLEIALGQVRRALANGIRVSAWVEVQSLPPSARAAIYKKAAKQIDYCQARNRQSRMSHTNTTHERLRAMGINVDQPPSCVPADP